MRMKITAFTEVDALLAQINNNANKIREILTRADQMLSSLSTASTLTTKDEGSEAYMERVILILQEAKQGMTPKEIAKAYKRQGWPVPKINDQKRAAYRCVYGALCSLERQHTVKKEANKTWMLANSATAGVAAH